MRLRKANLELRKDLAIEKIMTHFYVEISLNLMKLLEFIVLTIVIHLKIILKSFEYQNLILKIRVKVI